MHNRTHRMQGFSLVELMVGLVVGMIGVVIMMQIFSVSEGYKRTTTGGDDAQAGILEHLGDRTGQVAPGGVGLDHRKCAFDRHVLSLCAG